VSDDFDTEPVPGLPELLPEGETMLWQGSPDWKSLARGVMHADLAAGYFGILLAWPFVAATIWDQPMTEAIAGSARTAIIATIAIGLLCLIAWLMSRTTIYTITNRRVVMRYGIALPMTINLPFTAISAAALNSHKNGTGDIALSVTGPLKLAYLNLWPNARPWHVSKTEPAMRSVPNGIEVATLLAQAMSGATVRPLIANPAATKPGRNPISQVYVTA
jgi:Bacterial PH domain